MIDLIRVFAVAEAAVVFGITLRVFALYSKANRLALERGELVRALLPRHVAFISAAYLTYVAAGLVRITALVGEPVSIDATPAALVANSLGIYALVLVMKFEQRRVDVEKSYITDLRGTPREEGEQE